MIMDKTECATACHELGATPTNNLRNGKPCYRAGNGKCRQNGGHRSGASLICKNKGNQLAHNQYYGEIDIQKYRKNVTNKLYFSRLRE